MPSYGVGVVPKMVFHRNKIHADQRSGSIISSHELQYEENRFETKVRDSSYYIIF